MPRTSSAASDDVGATKWLAASACLLFLAAAAAVLGVSAALPSAADLAHCPTSCGIVTNISYPFGIGHGCFRPGFEVICNRTTRPPKLFLGNTTTRIVKAYPGGDVDASAIVVFDTATRPAGALGNYTWSWATPSLTIPSYSSVMIVGCGVEAWLFDTNNSNMLMGYCATTCVDMVALKEAEGEDCRNGMGCCYIETLSYVRPFRLSIIQKEVAVPVPLANATIKAFLTDAYSGYSFSMPDLVSDKVNESTIGAVSVSLRPVITDQPDCTTAQLEPQRYACAASNTICLNYDIDEIRGYSCFCSSDTSRTGNPYLDGGCTPDYNPSHQEKLNCSRSCGNASIPFPFGLEPECSASKKFQLNCTSYHEALIGEFPAQYQVLNISVDEGLLFVNNYNPQDDGTSMDQLFIISYGGNSVQEGTAMAEVSGLLDFDFSEQYGVWKWAISNTTCDDIAKNHNQARYACISAHSECTNATRGHVYIGYRCKCSLGYKGNPYVVNGCTDINECLIQYTCNGTCHNWDGGYNCTSCPQGTSFDPAERHCTSSKHHSNVFAIAIGLGCGFGVLALALGTTILIKQWTQHIQKKIRRSYFKRNKGLLLEQLISSKESAMQSTKIFSLNELEIATNCFDSTRIVGSGGHGTVYKGILSDQRVVAIKKSKIIEQSEIDQFINEVVILSQIIHRNVVKLFGCCLESEVPLLVYEFISNGTLYALLHGDLNTRCLLTWDDRTRIALESASALAYLHSAASIPIFHRDVKSANILLNDSFTTKVSDFGASRSISIDETHVVTIVQGTFGYLDPEYYHTGQLNGKSDVYSFGVILVELLTRKKPIFLNCNGEKQNLSHWFLQKLRDKRITEILDPHVIAEANEREIDEMASLAEKCLKLQGEERPTMREVELRLQLLRGKMTNNIEDDLHVDNETEPMLLSTNPCAQYIELGAISNSMTHETTRCYTMEKDLVSWSDVPR